MRQLLEFCIVQTNVEVQNKHQKEAEEGNRGAHSYVEDTRLRVSLLIAAL